jgi:signal transduction histidine kinase
MDASLWELRAPPQSERLEDMLRARAAELSSATSAAITVSGHAPALPGWVSTHIYRIASEAVTNAVRHGSPTQIGIDLAAENGELELSVTDDGRGVPSNGGAPSHGLESMRARALAIEGEVSIEPAGGRGTIVRLRVPVHPEKGADQ